MSPDRLRALLEQVAAKETTPEAALHTLEKLPFEDLGFARIDHHRQLRTGVPEIVYGPGKTPEQIAVIMERVLKQQELCIVTRVDASKADQVSSILSPELRRLTQYKPESRVFYAGSVPVPSGRGTIAVVSAGTSDQPVAEEAAFSAELLGNTVERIYDVGVAGLHRVLAVRDRLEQSEVVIVVAGMEGALPSVVKGLISRPVIAVPTSVGFGLHLNGFAALLSMLNACALGIVVVNVDGGFNAGYAASLMNRPSVAAR